MSSMTSTEDSSKNNLVPYNTCAVSKDKQGMETIKIWLELLDEVDTDDVKHIQVSEMLDNACPALLTPKQEQLVFIKEEFQVAQSEEALDTGVEVKIEDIMIMDHSRWSMEDVISPPSSTLDQTETSSTHSAPSVSCYPFIDLTSHYLTPTNDAKFTISNLDADPSSSTHVTFTDTPSFTVGHIESTDDTMTKEKEGVKVFKCLYVYSLRERLMTRLASGGNILCFYCGNRNTDVDSHLMHVRIVHCTKLFKCCPLCPFKSSFFRKYHEHEATHALDGVVHCIFCRQYFSNKASYDIHLDILPNGCFWSSNKCPNRSSRQQHQQRIMQRAMHLMFGGSIVCPHCQSSSSNIFNYLDHFLEHCTGHRMACVSCPSVHFTLKEYEEHKASHREHLKVHKTFQPNCNKDKPGLPKVESEELSCKPVCNSPSFEWKGVSSININSSVQPSPVTLSKLTENPSNAPSAFYRKKTRKGRLGQKLSNIVLGTPSLDCIRCNTLFTDIEQYKRHLLPCSSVLNKTDNVNLSQSMNNVTPSVMRPVEGPKATETLPGSVSFKLKVTLNLMRRFASHTLDGKIYCPHCKFSCSSVAGYLRHAITHSSPTLKACLHCKHVSEQTKTGKFLMHKTSRFKCIPCGMHFCRLLKYSRHMFDVHEAKVIKSGKEVKLVIEECKDDKVHRCRQCTFKTTNYSELTTHWATVHESVLRSCPCCSYSDYSKLKFLDHLKTHLTTGKHACDHCYFKHDSKEVVALHVSQHMVKGRLVCQHCLQEQHTPTEFSDVDSTLTSSEAPFEAKKKCAKCNYSSICKTDYKLHKVLHTFEKSKKVPNLSCKFCDYKTAYKGSLKFHIARHTGQGIRHCPHCQYSTPYKRCMRFHLSKHTGEGLLFCKSCPFSTCYKSIFKHHQALHTKQGIMTCPHDRCGYTTPYRSTFQQHMKKHSPDTQAVERTKSESWSTEDRWIMLFALEYSKALRSDTKSFSKSWQKIFYHHCSKPDSSVTKAHSLKAKVDLNCPFKMEAVELLREKVAQILRDKSNPLAKPVPLVDVAQDNVIEKLTHDRPQNNSIRLTATEKWSLLWIDHYLKASCKRRKEFGREYKKLVAHHCPYKQDLDQTSPTKLRASLRRHVPFSNEEVRHMMQEVAKMVANETCPYTSPVVRLDSTSAETIEPDAAHLDDSCQDSDSQVTSSPSLRSLTSETEASSTETNSGAPPQLTSCVASDPEEPCLLKASYGQAQETLARTTIQMRMFKKPCSA